MRGKLAIGGLALAICVSVVAAGASGALGGPSSRSSDQVRRGGTVVFGAEQETDCFNPILDACNQFWNQVMVWSTTMAGAFRITPKFTFQPWLVSRAVQRNRPFTTTYYLRKNARWSDGRPITMRDFQFTWRWIMDPKCEVAGREGYQDIRGFRALSRNGKTFRITWKRPYVWWRVLFSSVLPEHALRGEDCNKTWQNNLNNPKTGRPIASGPFIFQSYRPGQSLTIVRNPRYFGKRANVDRIVFRFLTQTSTEIAQIRGGEVDAIYPQPQLELASLRGQRGLRIQTHAGATWEHIDMQLSKNAAALKQAWVRKAIIQGINRQLLVRGLFRTLKPGLPVLNNVMFVSNNPFYQPAWNVWKYRPQRSISILRSHRCTGGPSRPGSGGGIYSCPGLGRLSFDFVSTAGNRLRELAFEVVQRQLRSIGIELRSAFAPAAIAFGRRLVNKQFDMFMFAWVESGFPAGKYDLYGCKGQSNYMDYCNRRVDSLLRRATQQTSPRRASTFYNRANRIIAGAVPTVPLYQKPTYLVYKSSLRNMVDNTTNFGPTWNVENWWKAR
jgi:peptide/nickel transport system substrate-binding protein